MMTIIYYDHHLSSMALARRVEFGDRLRRAVSGLGGAQDDPVEDDDRVRVSRSAKA
jgi:hypothetical protein